MSKEKVVEDLEKALSSCTGMSYTEIYEILRNDPSLKINSPQTVRNICIKALNKLRARIDNEKKDYLLEALLSLNNEANHFSIGYSSNEFENNQKRILY